MVASSERVKATNVLEDSATARMSQHANKKEWKSWTKSWHRQAGKGRVPKKGNAKAFLKRFGSGF